ncbi:MAG: hypothetical protein WBA16_10420 [Nonlabens sp.]
MFTNKYLISVVLMGLAFAKAVSQSEIQQKYERERRIEIEEFPTNALEVVALLNPKGKKIRFYEETDGTKLSYEAKLRSKGRKYSIEFNSDGILEDVEIRIPKRKINPVALERMDSLWRTVARKYRIEKVQEQYPNDGNSMMETIARVEQRAVQGYEVVVAFKDQRKIYRKEYLIDHLGRVLQVRNVKRIGYDFLLF